MDARGPKKHRHSLPDHVLVRNRNERLSRCWATVSSTRERSRQAECAQAHFWFSLMLPRLAAMTLVGGWVFWSLLCAAAVGSEFPSARQLSTTATMSLSSTWGRRLNGYRSRPGENLPECTTRLRVPTACFEDVQRRPSTLSQCSVWNSAFRRSEHLRKHLRSHVDDKPFVCSNLQERICQTRHAAPIRAWSRRKRWRSSPSDYR